MRKLVFGMLFAMSIACSGAPAPDRTAATPAITAPLAPSPDGMAPRPFTAEQIRAAMPIGHSLRLRMEVAGAPTEVQHWVVTAADATACTIASKVYREDGTLSRDEGSGTSAWAELREHGAFPASATQISDGSIEVPAGRFATRVYRVTTRDERGTTVKTLHFANTLPGPPVLMTVEVEGMQVLKMTMLERK